MDNVINEYTEREKVLAQYRELQAAAYQRRLKAALTKTTAKSAKDMAFLLFCLALGAAIIWVGSRIWMG
jgi:hypothetical protein